LGVKRWRELVADRKKWKDRPKPNGRGRRRHNGISKWTQKCRWVPCKHSEWPIQFRDVEGISISIEIT